MWQVNWDFNNPSQLFTRWEADRVLNYIEELLLPLSFRSIKFNGDPRGQANEIRQSFTLDLLGYHQKIMKHQPQARFSDSLLEESTLDMDTFLQELSDPCTIHHFADRLLIEGNFSHIMWIKKFLQLEVNKFDPQLGTNQSHATEMNIITLLPKITQTFAEMILTINAADEPILQDKISQLKKPSTPMPENLREIMLLDGQEYMLMEHSTNGWREVESNTWIRLDSGELHLIDATTLPLNEENSVLQYYDTLIETIFK